MFTARLFTAAQRGEQPECPSTDEWISRIGYIHTVGYYSGLKRKEILIHATMWINLEDMMLRETSQSQKDKYYLIPLPWGTRNGPIHRRKVEWRFPGTDRCSEWGVRV